MGLSSALKYIEDLSSLPTPTTSDKYQNGNVVTVGDKEYMRTGKTSSSAGKWIELGDESSHALKTITITGTGALSGGGTLEQNRTITHTNSGVTAGTYKSVTVNAYGHVTAGTNPTTIAGYGITDAKIANGTITLGSNTITPITSHQDISGLVRTSDLTASTVIANSHVELADRVDMSCTRLNSSDDLDLLFIGGTKTIQPAQIIGGYKYNNGIIVVDSNSKAMRYDIPSDVIGIVLPNYSGYQYTFTDASLKGKVWSYENGVIIKPDNTYNLFWVSCASSVTTTSLTVIKKASLLTSTSQNKVERYDWQNGSKPSNVPTANAHHGTLVQLIQYKNSTVTEAIQRCTCVNGDEPIKIYERSLLLGYTTTWTSWVELTQESRALTEEEITNIWNNVFN